MQIIENTIRISDGKSVSYNSNADAVSALNVYNARVFAPGITPQEARILLIGMKVASQPWFSWKPGMLVINEENQKMRITGQALNGDFFTECPHSLWDRAPGTAKSLYLLAVDVSDDDTLALVVKLHDAARL